MSLRNPTGQYRCTSRGSRDLMSSLSRQSKHVLIRVPIDGSTFTFRATSWFNFLIRQSRAGSVTGIMQRRHNHTLSQKAHLSSGIRYLVFWPRHNSHRRSGRQSNCRFISVTWCFSTAPAPGKSKIARAPWLAARHLSTPDGPATQAASKKR